MVNLLLVEDDPDLSETLKDWLMFNGHNVEAVYTGIDALEQMRFGSYDLVILDWHLPGMNGVDVLRAYRSEGGKTPVLMLTGRTEAKEIQTLIEAGATRYMAKPFNLKDLAVCVKELGTRASTV